MDVLRYSAGMITFALLLLTLGVYPLISLTAGLAAVDAVLLLRIATLRRPGPPPGPTIGRRGGVVVEEGLTAAWLAATFVILFAIDRMPTPLLGAGWTGPSAGSATAVEWVATLAALGTASGLAVGLTLWYVRANLGLAEAA